MQAGLPAGPPRVRFKPPYRSLLFLDNFQPIRVDFRITYSMFILDGGNLVPTDRGFTLKRKNKFRRVNDLRHWLYNLVFEADTAVGRVFDIVLLLLISLSVIAVMLESVAAIEARFGPQLRAVEWGFTILFTIEYLIRLFSVKRPWRYATSFYGIVDLLAVIPTYLSLIFTGTQEG